MFVVFLVVSGKNAFKAIGLRKHGEEERVQVACHIFPVDSADQLDLRIVVVQYSSHGILNGEKQLEGLIGVAIDGG